MFQRHKFVLALTLCLTAAAAHADPLVYVLTDSGQFGTVDYGTGAFNAIGPGLTVSGGSLVQGPAGTFLTLTFAGDLNSINAATGVASLIGPTGLADCTFTSSPCGPHAAGVLGNLAANVYATDFAQNLYSVNLSTGGATLIGPTGIPPLDFIPHDSVPGDPDSIYIFDESMFGSNGKLYIDFDSGTLDLTTFTVTPLVAPALYQINPSTGLATLVTSTPFGLSAINDVGGTPYAFSIPDSQVVTLNLTNGHTTFVSDADPSAGIINGAASPVPEPTSLALVGTGLAAIATGIRRRRSSR